jgi:hypothetical protein
MNLPPLFAKTHLNNDKNLSPEMISDNQKS